MLESKYQLNAKREDAIKYQAVGFSGQNIEEVYFRRVRHKLATILNDSVHNLYSDSSRMEGSGRLRRKWKTASSTRKN